MSKELALPETTADDNANEGLISVVKAAFSMVPLVGGALDELAFEARGRLIQKRFNMLTRELAEDVRRLKEEAIDRKLLASEEFSDLLQDILRRAVQTRGDARRAAFRCVLVNALQGRTDPDFAALFANILSEISEPEIALLQRFGKLPAEPERNFAGRSAALQRFSYTEEWWGCESRAARQIVQALVARGLLADDSHGHYDAEPFTFIQPTELGSRFLEWLTEK